MCHKETSLHRGFAAHGFALPSAIFLLVVLAALGGFMLIISSVQQTTSAQDVQGARAFQAARAGIEWGMYKIMQPENNNHGLTSGFTIPYACAGAMAGSPLANLGGSLAGFEVAVSCEQSTANEGGNIIRVYQITAIATSGDVGAVGRVERRISATVGTCRQPSVAPEANGASC